jgi:hypothetical protein
LKFLRFLSLVAVLALSFATPDAFAQKKVLRIAFRTAESGFDPQRVYDRYSTGVLENIYEPLLTYDYLARPVKLVPLVAETVPEPEENGTRSGLQGTEARAGRRRLRVHGQAFPRPEDAKPLRVAIREQDLGP